MEELISLINNAFFGLEQFINGHTKEYKYFGFYSKIELLVSEFSDPRNITKKNNELLYHYDRLCEQIATNYERNDFFNKESLHNQEFCKDCLELIDVLFSIDLSTVAYLQKDELSKREYSIKDILKKNPKNKKPTASLYAEMKFSDLFKSNKDFNKLIKTLKQMEFIKINSENNFYWKGSVEETNLKPLKLLCVLPLELQRKNYLVPNLKNIEISQVLGKAFNIVISDTYYGQVKKEHNERSSHKILDYISTFHFINTL